MIVAYILSVLGIILLILQNPLGELYNLSELAFKYYKDGLLYYGVASVNAEIIDEINIREAVASKLYSLQSPLFIDIKALI